MRLRCSAQQPTKNVCAPAWWVHLKVFLSLEATVTADSLQVLMPAADAYTDVVAHLKQDDKT
jgi:hypothetical protein